MPNYEQIINIFGEQRDMTDDETLSYHAYLDRISQPTGFNAYDILW